MKDDKEKEYEILFNKEKLIKYIKDNNINNCKELAISLDMRYGTVQQITKEYDIRNLFDYNGSYKEKLIRDLIPTTLNPIYNYKFSGRKELDIYIPEIKLGIEFDGNYWHSDIVKGKFAQYDKTNDARNIGIEVYHIYEWEWDNYKEYIESSLKRLFNTSTYKIDAKDCKILISKFNNRLKYSLLTSDRVWLNLTFLKINETEYRIEIIRYGDDCKAYNGLKLIVDKFIEEYNPNIIYYKSDESKVDNDELINYGFKFYKQYEPNFVYITKNSKPMINSIITEDEAIKNQYYKVYNCGYIDYIWINPKNKEPIQ